MEDGSGLSEGAPALEIQGSLDFPVADQVVRVRDVARGAGDAIWILNSTEPLLIKQNAREGVTAMFGRYGDGPDDFGSTLALVSATDSSVTVIDRVRGKIRTFDELGREASPVQVDSLATLVPPTLGEMLFGSPFKVRANGVSIALYDFPELRSTGTAHLWNGRIVVLEGASLEPRVLLDLRTVRDLYQTELAGATILNPNPLWARCGDGALVAYIPHLDEVRFLDGESHSFGVSPIADAMPQDMIRRTLREGLARRPGRPLPAVEIEGYLDLAIEELGEEISRVQPRYTEMLCDDRGRVWLQRFDTAGGWLGRSGTWEIFEASGAPLGEIQFPEGFQPLRLDEEGALGTVESDLGVQHIRDVRVAG